MSSEPQEPDWIDIYDSRSFCALWFVGMAVLAFAVGTIPGLGPVIAMVFGIHGLWAMSWQQQCMRQFGVSGTLWEMAPNIRKGVDSAMVTIAQDLGHEVEEAMRSRGVVRASVFGSVARLKDQILSELVRIL